MMWACFFKGLNAQQIQVARIRSYLAIERSQATAELSDQVAKLRLNENH